MSRRSRNDSTPWGWIVLLLLGMMVLGLVASAVGALFNLVGNLLVAQALWVGFAAGIGVSALLKRKLLQRSYHLEAENRELKATVQRLSSTVDQFIEAN